MSTYLLDRVFVVVTGLGFCGNIMFRQVENPEDNYENLHINNILADIMDKNVTN